MSGADDPRYLVLNAVMLKKMATADAICRATGLEVEAVEGALEALAADGAVARFDSRVMPMDSARAEVLEHTARHYPDLAADPVLARWLTRFESLNVRFLETVTDWQQVTVAGARVPNDHTDADYDNRVISRIDAIISLLARQIDQIAGRVPRLARYRERLEETIERVAAGEVEYLSSPGVDSVHNIWFELHEDVLTLFGKERAE